MIKFAVPEIKRTGRPNKEAAEEIVGHVVAVAEALFIERGYGGTSITAVAALARVGKHTLYRRFPDKASLYREVMRRRMEEDVAVTEVENLPPLQTLKALGAQALSVVTNPKIMALNRALVAEASNFPDLTEVMADYWERAFVIRFVEATGAAQKAGLCIAGDPDQIGRWYLGGVVGEPLRLWLIQPSITLSPREKKRHLESTWELFLRAITPAA